MKSVCKQITEYKNIDWSISNLRKLYIIMVHIKLDDFLYLSNELYILFLENRSRRRVFSR